MEDSCHADSTMPDAAFAFHSILMHPQSIFAVSPSTRIINDSVHSLGFAEHSNKIKESKMALKCTCDSTLCIWTGRSRSGSLIWILSCFLKEHNVATAETASVDCCPS
jgi:hypothetical protein